MKDSVHELFSDGATDDARQQIGLYRMLHGSHCHKADSVLPQDENQCETESQM